MYIDARQVSLWCKQFNTCCVKGSLRSEAHSKLTKLCVRTCSQNAIICPAKNRSLRGPFTTGILLIISKRLQSVTSTQFLFMSLFKKVIKKKKKKWALKIIQGQHSNDLLRRRTMKINFANCIFKAKW